MVTSPFLNRVNPETFFPARNSMDCEEFFIILGISEYKANYSKPLV
jgi:hypothetical protein